MTVPSVLCRAVLLIFRRYFDFAVALFKFGNALTYQIKYLSICGTSLVITNVMELFEQFSVNPKTEVFLRFHNITALQHYYDFILTPFYGIMQK